MNRPTTLGEVLLARGLMSVDRYHAIVARLRQTYLQPSAPPQLRMATEQVPFMSSTGRYTKTFEVPAHLDHDSNVQRAVEGWQQSSSSVTASGSHITGGSSPRPQPPPVDPKRRPDAFLRKKLGVPPHQEQFPIGPWMVLQYLDTGNWGIVYRVTRMNGDGRPYALKLLKQTHGSSDQVRKRFIQEARTMAKLRHPGICHVHDAGVYQGFIFFVMDFLNGPVLKELFEAGPLGVEESLRIVTQLCSAVDYAHSQGILHRDLKPENVIMVGGNAVLTDFGLAKDTQSGMNLTMEGQRIGTPLYMAPELLLDANQATEVSEVYSLAAMLYQCLTGHVPFFAKSMFDLVDLIEGGKLAPMKKYAAGVPRKLEKLCRRALHREPTKRPQSVSDLCAELERFAG